MRKELLKLYLLLLVAFVGGTVAFGQTEKGNRKQTAKQDTLDSRLIQVHKIFILGNEKTKDYIITRELRLQEGEYVPAGSLDELVETSRNNVYNTNLFYSVTIDQLELDSATVDLLIKVEERWYIWPSPVFRLADRNFNDWWYNRDHDPSRVKYGLKLDVYNFRGRKESLRFIGLTGFEKRLIFQYSIPYIDKSQKHGLTFGGGYLNNKKLPYMTTDHFTVFTDSTTAEEINREATSGYIVYTYRPSFYNYHYLMLQGYSMNISDTIAALNPNYFGEGTTSQQVLGLSYSFSQDKRNNKNYPLTGHKTLAMIEKLGLGIFKDVDIWRLTANHYHYFDMGSGFYGNVSIGGQLTTSDNVPYFNYTQFGLDNYYVRGYELDVIEGPQNFLTKNTLKKRLLSTQANLGQAMPLKKFRKIPFAFYAKMFGDAGWVNNYPGYYQSDVLTNRLLYGVGLGLDIVTLYDITFRFEYSYNSQGELNFFINFQSEL
ncbi:MAG: POTRA domain-containing protein [Marinoscillum sp.]|uniref:POTRA domain-containing protein n=2 Tax=Marinoscillum sp. TaxID=2024838 RepID=UPI0033008D65